MARAKLALHPPLNGGSVSMPVESDHTKPREAPEARLLLPTTSVTASGAIVIFATSCDLLTKRVELV